MKTVFFVEYVKNVRTVGAIAPSSRYLAKKMLAGVDFATAEVIVEYGPGTGVFTSEMIKRKRPETKLFVIERNEVFSDVLVKKYAHHHNVYLINDSVEQIEKILKQHKVKRVDYIVSGLPFAALPVQVSEKILTSTAKLLGAHGTFITFQYTMLKKNYMHRFFKHIVIAKEYRNLPPACVFCCDNE